MRFQHSSRFLDPPLRPICHIKTRAYDLPFLFHSPVETAHLAVLSFRDMDRAEIQPRIIALPVLPVGVGFSPCPCWHPPPPGRCAPGPWYALSDRQSPCHSNSHAFHTRRAVFFALGHLPAFFLPLV